MKLDACDEDLAAIIAHYVGMLALPTERLWITTDRAEYGRWLGRRIPSAYGGAYCYLRQQDIHAVLIHLDRIDRSQPRAVEVVVAEELVHMRDHLDGDRRRHAKHGYDRVAHRVADLTGASLEEIRSALIPVRRRTPKYVYACPGCGARVARRTRGTWSCGRCSPVFDRRFVLRLVETLDGVS
ncbi:MAG TPA: hypothetical protein VNP95_08280 [Thermomicrobiales bacterium]|nr:hypothetical protein [Thermomicrobiales bacterium]